jgi:CDP-diacylglycerol--serine O-phosphatidyltransferase
MNIKHKIPNILTLLNLLAGLIALVYAFNNELVIAAYLIGVSAIFDFLDGMAARLLNARSELGKQLDSLADLVSFGVVPGVIMYVLIKSSPDCPVIDLNGLNIIPMIAFLIPLMSAYRLAKFNIDTRQTESFLGLPTPASALFVGSLPLILMQDSTLVGIPLEFLKSLFENPLFLITLSIILSLLLVLEIPLFSLKFKSFAWKGNEIRYTFLIGSLVLLSILYFAAIPIIIVLYICFSVYTVFQRS